MKLRAYRTMTNLTQHALAERLGVSDLSVIKYESGAMIPSKEAMLRIYEITGGLVTPNDFFDLDLIPKANLDSPNSIFVSIGLMSGTSMDGIEGSLLLTDGEQFVKELDNHSLVYDPEFKLLLKGCEFACFANKGNLTKASSNYKKLLQQYLISVLFISPNEAKNLYQDLCFYFHAEKDKDITFDDVTTRSTDLHADVIKGLLKKSGYKAQNIDIVGYHGQTLFHKPDKGISIQIGDGHRLANKTDITVVFDFRSNDIKHGGQGAPFAPLYHKALASQLGLSPVVVANCGGISNITVIGSGDTDLYAYDCGPGNVLVDKFVQLKINKAMDQDGKYGSRGQIVNKALQSLKEKAVIVNGSNYLKKKPPKSLDVNDAQLISSVKSLSLQDGCATLEAFTADCIVESLDNVPIEIPKLWVLAGGGWKNKKITNELKERLEHKLGSDIRVQHADQVGWNGQAMEAQIFAYMAVRSLRKLPLSLPGTTGVSRPISGGKLVLPYDDLKKTTRNVRSLLGKTNLSLRYKKA